MTKEELIRYGKDYLHNLETACCPIPDIHEVFVREATKALEIVEEFEKAQIITGGRLNGRTYAYNCGLEDGKRKALEQQTCEDCVRVLNMVMKYTYGMLTAEKIGLQHFIKSMLDDLPPVTPTQSWIPLVWDEYPTVDSDGNDDYVYAVDYSIPMPKEDEWVLITDENHNVVKVQYDGYDFGDYARENILAWQPLPKAYEDK